MSETTNIARATQLLSDTGSGLSLQFIEGKLALTDGSRSVCGDFSLLARRAHGGVVHRELLVRAAKVKHAESPFLIDATAGLGEDSFLLASAGFRVLLCENDPVIAALLRDALTRARESAETKRAAQRMELFEGDSISLLASTTEQPDVVYLDPMFPARTKSAAVKKKFQLLHALENPCANETELMEAALSCNPQKVVIKRPAKGPFLAGLKPSYSLAGKAVRFDVIVPASTAH